MIVFSWHLLKKKYYWFINVFIFGLYKVRHLNDVAALNKQTRVLSPKPINTSVAFSFRSLRLVHLEVQQTLSSSSDSLSTPNKMSWVFLVYLFSGFFFPLFSLFIPTFIIFFILMNIYEDKDLSIWWKKLVFSTD